VQSDQLQSAFTQCVDFNLEQKFYRFAEGNEQACDTTLFNPESVQSQPGVSVIDTHGRGRVLQFQRNNRDLVLREYRRGGIARHFSQNRYWWPGLLKTRPWREFTLLASMSARGLPCPRPYACYAHRHGMTYTASLITELIPNTQTLAQILQKRELSAAVWYAIGQTLCRFHNAGIYHADLNAHNILLDNDDQIYVIDFDRGSQKKDARGWKFDNLKRLQRSIKKCWMQADLFYFSPASWDDLRDGYLAQTKSSGVDGAGLIDNE